jgi:hypothetical protein
MEILSIRELSKLNLAGLEHATLSSCWSADNFIAPGRIIISLPETLRRAGTASILGALWPIQDSFAVAFMERFHENLEKYPRDKALQKTQLDCIYNKLTVEGKIKPENPSHWAAFNLYGTAKRLPIKNNNSRDKTKKLNNCSPSFPASYLPSFQLPSFRRRRLFVQRTPSHHSNIPSFHHPNQL